MQVERVERKHAQKSDLRQIDRGKRRSMKSFAEWLREAGLERYVSVFAEDDIDFGNASTLSEADLRELGLTLGHRKNFLAALAALQASISARPGESSNASPAAAGPPPTGQTISKEASERRQLTVLFCDLVGFTELATRLDPELLQGVVRSYEDACAVCITRYEGYVFQRLGDGIVAFFGYPLAHEGEAEQAIRAGLEILEALSELDVPAAGRLRVRIGIATGVVVVSAASKGATGETVNLASRLQGIAQPGQIVIAERTRQLAGGTFDYEDLGAQSLKGIAQPVPAWRVSGLSRAESRFDAATLHGLTPLVGRAQETALLLERWDLAQEGEDQAVLLSGEPGIGKSRIVRALGDALGERVSTVLRCQCSPSHVNSAFYPIIDTLERGLRFTREEPVGSKLDKLEALMVGQHGRPLLDVCVIALLLSISTEGRYEALRMTPQRQKEETTRAIVDLVEASARAQPTLMLFKDTHWAAYKLAKSLHHRESYLHVLGGLWNIDVTQGRIAESLKWAEEHLELGESLGDRDLKIAGHLFSRNSHLFLGHFEVARQHGERVVELYDPERARQVMRLVHYDMLTSHGVYGAPCLWFLGYPERALRLHKTTDTHSREFDQPINLCYALTMGSWIFHLRREPDRLLAYVEQGIALARAHSLPFFSEVVGPLWKGAGWLQAGRVHDGVELLQGALDRWMALGCRAGVPAWTSMLAKGIARTGDIDKALRLLEGALTQIERPGWEERYYMAEVLLVKGTLLQQRGELDEAEEVMRAGLGVAREQQARSWELRVATTLASLMKEQGRRRQALDLLHPVYRWFTEGFDTRDLIEAKALLDELRG